MPKHVHHLKFTIFDYSHFITQNCPPVNPNVTTTPDYDNYTITITGYNPMTVTDCQYQQPMITEGDYNITITINNIIGSSEPTTVSFGKYTELIVI